jgi:uncharacterized protein (DUF2147 family)
MRSPAALLAAALLAAALALTGPAAAQPGHLDSPAGDWLVQDGDGVVRIGPCGDNLLCGTIVGTTTRKQCRLTILNVAAAPDGTWTGQITNPDNGTVWNAQIWLTGHDRMELRGYVLVPLLGETQTWTRYTRPLAPDCRMN